MKNAGSLVDWIPVDSPCTSKFFERLLTIFLRLVCFGGWTRGAFKYPADSSLRDLIHTMVTDNDAASTFWAGSPSDFSTFFVSLSVSSSLRPLLRFSLLLTTFGSLGVPSFFISFSASLCAVSIGLFLREDRIVPAGSIFVRARRRLESPITRGRPSISIESRHIDPRRDPRTAENKEESSLSSSPSLSCIATDY